MKQYHLYVFSQDNCAPCERLKEHVKTLTDDEQAELDFVPLRAPNGQYTALAKENGVTLTPTLLVTHEEVICDIDAASDEEFCDFEYEVVESFIGANHIIEHLQATLDAYTYAHPD